MNKEKYVKSVLKRLSCSRKTKVDIKKELSSNIQIALEYGESWSEIEERMGTPVVIAEEYNQGFSLEEKKRAKTVKIGKIAAVFVAIFVILLVGVQWMLPKSMPLGKDTVYTQEQVEARAKEIIGYINQDEYDIIRNQFSDEKLKDVLTKEAIISAKNQISSDWGAFLSFGKPYVGEVKQMGSEFVVVQVAGNYQNVSVTFTLSFDYNMRLAGFFMK